MDRFSSYSLFSISLAALVLVALSSAPSAALSKDASSGDGISSAFIECTTGCIVPCFTSGPLGEADDLFWACQRAMEFGLPIPPEFEKECERIKKCNERAVRCIASCEFYHGD